MLKSARIAVFVSGGGTNLQALLDAQRDGKIPHGEIALVISSQACAYALERAEKANVPAHTVPSSLIQHDFEAAIELLLEQYKIDVIVLAGFLSILSENFTKKWPRRILNIHPSLIPAFCGVGFYGLHSFTQNSVFKKVTVFYCFSDPCQLLIYNTSCPDIQVTDFGITHLPVWQAYGCTRTE